MTALFGTLTFCCAASLASAATTFYYDAAGRYAGHDNATGSLSLTRDALGRVSEQEASAPVLNVAFPTQFAHDEEGRLLWLRDRRGKTAEMRYDEAGRLTWLNHGQTTCSGSSIGQSIGPTTTWTYDDRDRIESVTHRGPPPSAGVPGPVLLSRTYERNAAGEPTRIHEQDGSYTEIDYDPAGRVQAERYFDEVDTLLEEITFTYDLDGNRTSRTSSAGLEVYEYDTGSRLTRVTLDGVETQRFEYDENGRVSRIVRDGLDQRLHWDALDRLVRVEDLSFVEDAVDFAYDGQGRRVSADRADSAQRYVVGPTGNQSLESPHLVHNGFFLTGELVYGGEHALWRYDGSEPPDTRVYLRDAMGSVIGLMDAEGNLLETFEYDAFGNVRSPGGEALPEVNLGGDSRFQGMWKDAGTGLYYVRARYYDPRTGRFLSRDPAEGQLEMPESFHPYVFANNNPRVFRDPAGRFSLRELGAAIMVRGQIAASSIGSAAIAFKNQVQAFARNGAQFVRAVGSRLQSVGGKALELIKLNRGGSRALAERFGMSSERVQLLQKIISKDGSIQTSKTVAKQLLEHPQRRRIPVQSILDAIGSGTRVADPQGVAGQYMYRVQASLNGKTGTLEVLVHEGLGQIRHVLFFTP